MRRIYLEITHKMFQRNKITHKMFQRNSLYLWSQNAFDKL